MFKGKRENGVRGMELGAWSNGLEFPTELFGKKGNR